MKRCKLGADTEDNDIAFQLIISYLCHLVIYGWINIVITEIQTQD